MTKEVANILGQIAEIALEGPTFIVVQYQGCGNEAIQNAKTVADAQYEQRFRIQDER